MEEARQPAAVIPEDRKREPSHSCPFCAIARGARDEQFVWQDERVVAFLDMQPVQPGHVQVIPRDHYPYFMDLPEDLLAHIALVGQKLARVLRPLAGVERVAFAFSGGDIAHVHAHIFPIHHEHDMTSRQNIADEHVTFVPRPAASKAERAEWAAQIRRELDGCADHAPEREHAVAG